MKQALNFSPTFVPAAQTLDFSGFSGFELKKLYAVVNETRRTVIYAPAMGTGFGYSSFGAGVITLDFNTTTHNAADVLTVIYELDGQRAMVDSSPVVISSDQTPVPSSGVVANPTANFTRPADTTQYTSGDLVANSTTAGSVVPLTLTAARVSAGSFTIRRVKLHKSTTTTTSASFRVHLFTTAPATITNGDNGAFSVSGIADYIGAADITMDRTFTDGAAGFGVAMIGSDFSWKLASGTTIRALIEARAAYTPGNAEVFTVTLDVFQD